MVEIHPINPDEDSEEATLLDKLIPIIDQLKECEERVSAARASREIAKQDPASQAVAVNGLTDALTEFKTATRSVLTRIPEIVREAQVAREELVSEKGRIWKI